MVKTRLFHTFLLGLSLSLMGANCQGPATSVGAGSPSAVIPVHSAEGPAGVAPASEEGPSVTAEPQAASQGTINPRPDSERFNEGVTAYLAYYGPGFSQQAQNGTVTLIGGILQLPLLIKKEVTDRETHAVTVTPAEAGMQIRLVHHYRDAGGIDRYSSCDALTTAVQADGSNVLFSRLIITAGEISLFYLKPDPTVAAPTSDFSSACVPLGRSEESPNVNVFGNLARGRHYEIAGSLVLSLPLETPSLAAPVPPAPGIGILATPSGGSGGDFHLLP